MRNTFRVNCDKNIVQQASSSPDFHMQFVTFVRPCMHHNYGGISESHACEDCVWPIIMDAGLYTTCPGEGVLVVTTRQVQCNIPTFEAVLK